MHSLQRTFIGALVLVMPASLAAQKMTPGAWTGTMTPPGNQTMDVAFNVRMSGDTTKITMSAGGREMELAGVTVEANRILFSFAPGDAIVRCTLLLRDDKSYSGDCVDLQGAKGVIVMRPPKS